MQMNQEEVVMLQNNLALQAEILERYGQLQAAGAFSEVQYLNQQNIVAETRGKLMQSRQNGCARSLARSTNGRVEVGAC